MKKDETKASTEDSVTKYIFGRDFGLNFVSRISGVWRREASPVRWHSHDGTEIQCMLTGEMSYEFKSKPSVAVSGGHFVVIPSGIIHHAAHGFEEPSIRLGILLTNTEKRNLPPFDGEDLCWCKALLSKTSLSPHPLSVEATTTTRRLFDFLEQRGFVSEGSPPAEYNHITDKRLEEQYKYLILSSLEKMTIRSLCCLALVELAAIVDGETAEGINPLVDKAQNYIERHYKEEVSMDDVAKSTGCCRSHLFSVFKLKTGMSPNDYLVRCRIREAQRLLRNPAGNITNIAFQVGFSSSQYFAKVFKKYVGVSPSGFAARNKNF